jgi:DNA polymerase III subunit delta'
VMCWLWHGRPAGPSFCRTVSAKALAKRRGPCQNRTMSETESDRLEGAPHPRETLALVGHAAQEAVVLEALATGRLHHAWLLGGPEGIGKATFAYRLARRLLAGVAQGQPPATLDVPAGHPVTRKIIAGSHPDLVVLRRVIRKDGKALTTNIPVELVRRALEVFETTSAAGGWRICIIDSAEDLDRASANALLKMIEEPPPNCLFLIVSHVPQRLLPTIRSRCRKLDFSPLTPAQVEEAMRATGVEAASPADITRAAGHGGGSVRAALVRMEPEALSLIEAVEGRLAKLPRLEMKALVALAEDVGARGRDDDLALVLDTVENWLSHTLRQQSTQGAAALLPLAGVWERARREAREADIYNLDKRPLVISLFQDLAGAMRHSTPETAPWRP